MTFALVAVLTDRQKIDYARSYLRRTYTGSDLTSGVLIVGKYYSLTLLRSGDDFTNIGVSACSLTHAGQIFKATGTTPTTWTNGSLLNEIRIDDLKTLATQTYAAATSTVTITAGAFEGGSGSGELTFEKSVLGIAIEELLAELDPGYIVPVVIPRREIGAVVRLGW